MFVSTSEGFCLEGLLGAILFNAADDIFVSWLNSGMFGGWRCFVCMRKRLSVLNNGGQAKLEQSIIRGKAAKD